MIFSIMYLSIPFIIYYFFFHFQDDVPFLLDLKVTTIVIMTLAGFETYTKCCHRYYSPFASILFNLFDYLF